MIIKAIKHGFQQAWHYRRVIGIMYLLVLLTALWTTLPFKGMLDKTIGHSLIVNDLLQGFDFTFWADYLNAHPGIFSSLIDHSLLTLLFFLLLFIFVAGGTTATIQQFSAPYKKQFFWGKSGYFFWRMLRQSLFFFVIHAIVFVFFGWLFLVITKGMDADLLKNETIIFAAMKWVPIIYVPFAAIFMMWQDYSKHFLVQSDDRWIYHSIRSGFKFILRNFRQTYGVYLVNIALAGLVLWLSFLVSKNMNPTSGSAIFLSFVMTQIFILARLAMKLVNTGSAWSLISQKETL